MARPKKDVPWFDRRSESGRGYFYAFWYDAEARQTRRLSLRTNDPVKAEARFANFLAEGAELRRPRAEGLTVAQALDDYVKEHVDVKCADPKRQRDATVHLKEFFGGRPLAGIDVPASQGYAAARSAGLIGGGARRKTKEGSPATIRRELVTLMAAANHARWMGRFVGEIQVDLPPERRLGPDDEAPYYEIEELERIFAAAADVGGEDEIFVRLLYYTGARRRSLENLDRAQVKWAARRLILQKPGKVATKKRQPIVPILKVMEPWVEKLLETGGRSRLFVNADFYRHYVAICECAGIDEARRNPHTMRHTRATHLLQDGKSIYDVAKLLGDTVATVERVYGHHSADQLANRLED